MLDWFCITSCSIFDRYNHKHIDLEELKELIYAHTAVEI